MNGPREPSTPFNRGAEDRQAQHNHRKRCGKQQGYRSGAELDAWRIKQQERTDDKRK